MYDAVYFYNTKKISNIFYKLFYGSIFHVILAELFERIFIFSNPDLYFYQLPIYPVHDLHNSEWEDPGLA
jgi:hypothetical protein